MTRVERLLNDLKVDQLTLAGWLGVSRSVVSRLKTGVTPDDGPIGKMLDHLDDFLVVEGSQRARALVLSGRIGLSSTVLINTGYPTVGGGDCGFTQGGRS